jgi:hypothetical protein
MLSKEEFVVLDHYLREGLPKAVLHHYLRERLPKAVIARKLGISCMTVHRHAATDKPLPSYGPRRCKPPVIEPYKEYLQGRLGRYPELSAVRLLADQGLEL